MIDFLIFLCLLATFSGGFWCGQQYEVGNVKIKSWFDSLFPTNSSK